jgi:hypothetical protein
MAASRVRWISLTAEGAGAVKLGFLFKRLFEGRRDNLSACKDDEAAEGRPHDVLRRDS